MPPSSTKRTKEKLKRWGDSDKAKLLHLIDSGKVDIESEDALEPDYIKVIRSDYFPERTYKNFAKNFRDFVADYTLGEEFDGARLRQLSRNNPAENDDDDEVFEENADATDDDEDQEAIMSHTAASAKKPAAKKTKSSDSTQSVAKTSPPLPPPPASFSLFTSDSYEKTRYVVDNVEFIELEIFVNGCIPSHAYQATLDPDKKIFYWKRATLKSVFSPARLQQSMSPGTYNPNHTRVAAHSETHQEVLTSNPASVQGWFFNDVPLSIELGVQVVGEPKVYISQYMVCEFAGQRQYNTIYSFVMQVARQRIPTKKKATQTAVLTLALDDDEDDNDGVPQFPPCAGARSRSPTVQQDPFKQSAPRSRGKTSHADTGRNTKDKKMLKGQAYAEESDASSSSEDDSDSDSDEDMDVKPPAKNKVKAESSGVVPVIEIKDEGDY